MPFEPSTVKEWFLDDDSMGHWQKYFHALPDRFYWAKGLVWLFQYMPAGDKDAWKPYVAQVGTWYWANLERVALPKLLSSAPYDKNNAASR